MSLGLGFSKDQNPETAQAAYTGARYYRTDSGVYLKDFGRGDSDDSAKLYSGQMLSFDGVDDYVTTPCELVNGDDYTICATCQRPNTANDGSYVSFSRFNNSIGYAGNYFFDVYVWDVLQEAYTRWRNSFASLGISNDEIFRVVVSVPNGGTPCVYINGVDIGVAGLNPTTNVSTGILNGKPVRMGYDGSNYLDSFLGNVQIWNAAFDADDVAFDYANCYQNLTADNRPGTSLTPASLKGHWPLIEGSGDVAYDWSGNGNHGTINLVTEGNTSLPTAWTNAAQLTDPSVIQTALCEWALKDSNNACVPLDTADSTNFTRDYSELNWNGRSFADCGNGADVNPSTALIIEMICNAVDLAGKRFFSASFGYAYEATGIMFVTKYTGGTAYTPSGGRVIDGDLFHVMYVFAPSLESIKVYNNGNFYALDSIATTDTLTSDATHLLLGFRNDKYLVGQIPHLKMWVNEEAQAIIDDDLDAWVAKRYAKAAAKYGL